MPQVDAFSREILAGDFDRRVIVVDSLVNNPALVFPADTVFYSREDNGFYTLRGGDFLPVTGGDFPLTGRIVRQVNTLGDIVGDEPENSIIFVRSEGAFYRLEGGVWVEFITSDELNIPLAQKGAPGGVATLGADAKHVFSELPDLVYEGFSVLDYGAVGDGVTNDSAAFAAALSAATAAGQATIIPTGTYAIESVVSVPANAVLLGQEGVELIGDGNDGFAPVGNFKLRNVSMTGFTDGIAPAYPSPAVVDRLVISDVEFRNGDSFIDYTNVADKVSVVLISDVMIEDLTSQGIRWGPQSDFVIISRVHVLNARNKGIQVGLDSNLDDVPEKVLIEDCTVRNSEGIASCQAINIMADQTVITNNFVDEVTTETKDDAEGIYTKSKNFVIANNVLRNAGWRQAAIALKGTLRDEVGISSPRGYTGVVANNVTFFQDRPRSIERTVGIDNEVSDVLICNNYIDGANTAGIRQGSSRPRNVVMRGNVVTRVFSNTSEAARGIYIDHWNGKLVVEGNFLFDIQSVSGSAIGVQVRTQDLPNPAQEAAIVQNNTVGDLFAGGGIGRVAIRATVEAVTVPQFYASGNQAFGTIDRMFSFDVGGGGEFSTFYEGLNYAENALVENAYTGVGSHIGDILGGYNSTPGWEGYWVRFADGTQICYYELPLGSRIAEGAGTYSSPFKTAPIDIIFPRAFIGPPTVTFGLRVNTENENARAMTVTYRLAAGAGTSLTDVQAVACSDEDADRQVYLSYQAIGRWK